MSYSTENYQKLSDIFDPDRSSLYIRTIDSVSQSFGWITERAQETEAELRLLSEAMEIRNEEEEMKRPARNESLVETPEESREEEEEIVRNEGTETESESENGNDVEEKVWSKEEILRELDFRGNLQRDFVAAGFNGDRIPYYLIDQTYEAHMGFGPVCAEDYNYPEEPWFKCQGKGITYYDRGVGQLGNDPNGPLLNLYPGKNPSNGRKNTGIVSLMVAGEEVNKPTRTCLSETFGCYPDEDRIHVIRGNERCWADFVEDDSGLVLMWHVSKVRFGGSRLLSASQMKRIAVQSGKISVFWGFGKDSVFVRKGRTCLEREPFTVGYYPIICLGASLQLDPHLGGPIRKTCLFETLKRCAIEGSGAENLLYPEMKKLSELDVDMEDIETYFQSKKLYWKKFRDGHCHIDTEYFPGGKVIKMGKQLYWRCGDSDILGRVIDEPIWDAFCTNTLYTLAVEGDQETFFSSVNYDMSAAPMSGGAWLELTKKSEGKGEKSIDEYEWFCSYPSPKTAVRFPAASSLSNEQPKSRVYAPKVPRRRLMDHELFSVGITKSMRSDGKVVYCLPCYPVGCLSDWCKWKIESEKCIVETPTGYIDRVSAKGRSTKSLLVLTNETDQMRQELLRVALAEKKYRVKDDDKEFEDFVSQMAEKSKYFQEITDLDVDKWQRLRHERCARILASFLGVSFEGTDVNLPHRFDYFGEGYNKTPDFAIELDGTMVLIDVKTTVGDPVRVSEELMEKYGPLKEGLQQHLNQAVLVAAVIFVFKENSMSVLMTDAIRNHVSRDDLERAAKYIHFHEKGMRKMRNYEPAMRSKNLLYQDKKGDFFREYCNWVMKRVDLKAPDHLSMEGTYEGDVKLVSAKAESLKGNDIFSYMKPNSRGAKKIDYKQIAIEILRKSDKERDPNYVSEVRRKLFEKLKIRRNVGCPEKVGKFNMFPCLGEIKNRELGDFYNGENGQVFVMFEFDDGTIAHLDMEEVIDDKSRKPIDAGCSLVEVAAFNSISEKVISTGLEKFAALQTELFENIMYMEGRRSASKYQIRELAKSPKYRGATRKLLKKAGATVSKRFPGYTIVIRKGSAITKEKQIKVKLFIHKENQFNHDWLKCCGETGWSKWYTLGLSQIGHLVRANEMRSGIGMSGMNKTWMSKTFLLYFFMRPATAEIAQNARYAWTSALSINGDKMKLVDTILPDFNTSRIDGVVINYLCLWWDQMLSESADQIRRKETMELSTAAEYDHMMFPSFWDPSERVGSETTMLEIYFCNMSSRSFGFSSHKQNKMVEKLLECETKWRKQWEDIGTHHGDHSMLDCIRNPAMFKYARDELYDASETLLKDKVYRVQPWVTFSRSLLKKLDELSTLKSSVEGKSGAFDENRRKKAAENFFEMYKKSGLLGIVSNLQSLDQQQPFYNDVFPKEQIGTREITILSAETRIKVWPVERLFEAFCKENPNEMITSKEKEQLQVETLSSFRETRLKYIRAGIPSNVSYHGLDATRWSPGFNTAQFGTLAESLCKMTPSLKIYAQSVFALLLEKEVRMPESWVHRAMKQESKMIDREFSNSQEQQIAREVIRNQGRMRNKSGMGQGIAHLTSSWNHCVVVDTEQRVSHVIAEILGIKSYVSRALVSSDDKTFFHFWVARNSHDSMRFANALWGVSCFVSPFSNIHQNVKKSFDSPVIGEFNSYFSVGKKPHYAWIKDVYSATAVPNMTNPEQAVESKLSDMRRLVEHGVAWDRLRPFYNVVRDTLIRRYTYRQSDIDKLCTMLHCNEYELPPQLGFMPSESNALISMLYTKEAAAFRGGPVLQRFYRNYYSNSKTHGLGGLQLGGKHSISLDMRFDQRAAKMRGELLQKAGFSEKDAKVFLNRMAMGKISGNSDPTVVLMKMLSFPMQLKDEDEITTALPVHSLIRAAQAARKVRVSGFDGHAKGLVEAASWILWKSDDPNIASNYVFFQASASISDAFDRLISKTGSVRWKISHGRVKPRNYNMTLTGRGTRVTIQNFTTDILCSPDPKMATARRITALEATSGGLASGELLSTDPMKFMRVNFGEDETYVKAENFFEFFISRQNFNSIRIPLVQPPDITGERNLAIVLSEVMKTGMIAKVEWDNSEENEVAANLVVKNQVMIPPKIISPKCSWEVQVINLWCSIRTGSDSSHGTLRFVNDQFQLLLCSNAMYIREMRVHERTHKLFIKNPDDDIDPVFLRIAKRDIETHEGGVLIPGNKYEDPSGLMFSKVWPPFQASMEGTDLKRDLVIWTLARKITLYTIETKSTGLAFPVLEKPSSETELINTLNEMDFPLSQTLRPKSGPGFKPQSAGNFDFLVNMRAGLESLVSVDTIYDTEPEETDDEAAKLAKHLGALGEMLKDQEEEKPDVETSNRSKGSLAGFKNQLGYFIAAQYMPKNFMDLQRGNLWLGYSILGRLSEKGMNKRCVQQCIMAAISGKQVLDDMPVAVRQADMDRIMFVEDKPEEEESPEGDLVPIVSDYTPSEMKILHERPEPPKEAFNIDDMNTIEELEDMLEKEENTEIMKEEEERRITEETNRYLQENFKDAISRMRLVEASRPVEKEIEEEDEEADSVLLELPDRLREGDMSNNRVSVTANTENTREIHANPKKAGLLKRINKFARRLVGKKEEDKEIKRTKNDEEKAKKKGALRGKVSGFFKRVFKKD